MVTITAQKSVDTVISNKCGHHGVRATLRHPGTVGECNHVAALSYLTASRKRVAASNATFFFFFSHNPSCLGVTTIAHSCKELSRNNCNVPAHARTPGKVRSATPVAIICEEALRRRFRVYTHRLSSVQFHFHRATDVKTGATLSEGRFVRLMDVEAKTKANQRDEAAKRCAPSNHATVDVIVAAPQNVRSARDITLPEIGEELRANRVYTQIEPRTDVD